MSVTYRTNWASNYLPICTVTDMVFCTFVSIFRKIYTAILRPKSFTVVCNTRASHRDPQNKVSAIISVRLNEIARLRLSDIVELDGVKCSNIAADNSEDNEDQSYQSKSAKTSEAERFVAIHSKLIELCLLAMPRS